MSKMLTTEELGFFRQVDQALARVHGSPSRRSAVTGAPAKRESPVDSRTGSPRGKQGVSLVDLNGFGA